MEQIGFDSKKYLKLQSEHIQERIDSFEKLYLEFGGKLFDDYHASRVLPGFAPDNKLKMLEKLKDIAEIIIVVNADAIEQNKIRSDLGITYDEETLRLKKEFEKRGFLVSGIVITQYTCQPAADKFRTKCTNLGVKTYLHYLIQGYPGNIPLIVSDDGYGRNEYIATKRKLCVVTAPGPGSGKMATCLSNLYHDHKHGIKAGYAKFETFPIWNLPLQHPVNLAYESATVDLDDVNMIDPFHLEAYGKTTVNYNRDVETFPVLKEIFKQILGSSPYQSPTDMGVNMAGFAIVDDEVCQRSAKEEMLRRYYATACQVRKGNCPKSELDKQEFLLKRADLKPEDRAIVPAALKRQAETGKPCAAIQLENGEIVVGRTSRLLGAAASVVLKVLKQLSGLPHEEKLLTEEYVKPIQQLKTLDLKSKNPNLHVEEALVALACCSSTNENAKLALAQLPKLRNLEFHSSVILSPVDEGTIRRLGMHLTCSPEYEIKEKGN
ncbi:MAG: DUF1846 domain-containing protein [Spirochaetia bacterium]|nr:DUF1846 domain-containing protein [Spirochaetia bacterium]MDD7699128.1 DUF1846 domain-containing protein [Spirochaetia bacterium]